MDEIEIFSMTAHHCPFCGNEMIRMEDDGVWFECFCFGAERKITAKFDRLLNGGKQRWWVEYRVRGFETPEELVRFVKLRAFE